MHQGYTENTTNLEHIHLELPTEVQMRKRLTSRENRKHVETCRKGEVTRGGDPVSMGGRPAGQREEGALGYRRIFSLRR